MAAGPALGHVGPMTSRRLLAASALPLLFLAATARGTAAKSLGPAALEACRPGAPAPACQAAKNALYADGAAGGGCPHCSAAASDKPWPAGRGSIPGDEKLF